MTELKSLNLSFNRITKVEGIQNLIKLQILELGKNYISDIDNLQSSYNPLVHLQELHLYINEIRNLPPSLSFA
jgi:Leucine-rich repeat (LRR) protein